MFLKNSPDYYPVGKVKDAHGIRGELYILLFAKSADWPLDLSEIQLEKSEPKEPSDQINLKVKKIRPHKQGLILNSEDLKTRNQAELLKGYLFYIPRGLLVAEQGERPYLLELMDLEVRNPKGDWIGRITGFSSNGIQDLVRIQNEDGEFEVPWVESFICDVDLVQKKVVMDIPEGLQEIAKV